MARSIGFTPEENEVTQQANSHKHPVDGVDAQIERVKSGLRKRESCWRSDNAAVTIRRSKDKEKKKG